MFLCKKTDFANITMLSGSCVHLTYKMNKTQRRYKTGTVQVRLLKLVLKRDSGVSCHQSIHTPYASSMWPVVHNKAQKIQREVNV